ncbi:MAG: hypothetical protein ACRCRQ_02600, partial [Metamycoplasmataceae bacterium]
IMTVPQLEGDNGFNFDFVVEWVMVDRNDAKNILVTVSIFETTSPTIKKITTFVISGFKVSTLEDEALKFGSVNTTNPNLSVIEVVTNINNAQGPEAKNDALRTFANIPLLAEGFTFEVISANINVALGHAVDVVIIVKEIGTTNTKEILYLVNGLKNSTVVIEKNKFNNPITTTKTDANIDVLVSQIVASGTNNIQKLLILKDFADIPTLAYGFELEIISAQKIDNTTMEIDARILETNTPNVSEEFKIIVNGFVERDLNSELIIELEKFHTTVQTKNITLYSGQAANNINSAVTNDDKLYVLSLIADVPALNNGFDMEIMSVESHNTEILHVYINIFHIQDQSINNNVIFEISGFRVKSLETEANKFEDTTTNTPERVSYKVVEDILDANTTTRKELLNEIMTVPQLEGDNGFNFDFVVEWVMVDRNDAKNILVTVSIFETTSPTIKKTTTFTISGFKVSTLEDEALKFGSVNTTNPNLSVIEVVTNITNAQGPEAKNDALRTFANIPILAEGFTFEVISANINGARGHAVDVVIIVKETGTVNTQEIIYLVNGLKYSTLDIEAQKFIESIRNTHNDSNISAEEWASRINDANNQDDKLTILNDLLAIYNLAGTPIGSLIPELSIGFSFEIGTATNITLPSENTNGVRIDIRVIDDQDGKKLETSLTITGFNKFEDTPLEKEAKKFNITLGTIQPTLSMNEAKGKFKTNDDSGNRTSLEELVSAENLPLLSDGFTFRVLGINNDLSTSTDLKVVLLVSDGSETISTLLTINGFTN